MKILVTGAAGFIGCNLTRYLLQDCGHAVVAVDKLTYAGSLHSLADVTEDPAFTFIHADICDSCVIESVLAECKPDALLHLAAESHVDRSIDGPEDFIQTNIVGTYRLLQCARHYYKRLSAEMRARFRFLHVSTDEVYGSLGKDDSAFLETTPYSPHSPYSASKAASDHLARAWHDTYDLPVIVTNCSNNYGPFQFPERLIPVAILKALRGEPIPVYGNGENIRDWLYVMDHAQALELVLRKGHVGQTYNIGGNNEQRNIELISKICTVLDEVKPRPDRHSYTKQVTFVADRPGHDLRYAMDTTKIREELGWLPSSDPDSAIRETVLWYLANQDWCLSRLQADGTIIRQGLDSEGGMARS